MKQKNQSKKYSMTAKQRKEQRLSQDAGKRPAKNLDNTEKESPPGVITLAVDEDTDVKSGLTPKKKWIIFASCALAVVMIVFAVLLPVVFVPMFDYRDIQNPVAVINLSTGDKIEMEIMEREVPHAATNFIYLAEKGFFDDTIIFDTTNDFVRFGQYESYTSFRSQNQDFLKTITDITIPSASSADSKFDYRLNADTAASAKTYENDANDFGFLSQTHNLSGTEFQICGADNSPPLYVNRKDGTGQQNMQGYVFGKPATDRTKEIIKKIVALPKKEDNGHSLWTGPAQTVKIKSVKIYKRNYGNVDKSAARKKWSNFNWDNYFNNNDNRLVYWYGGSGIPR